RRFEVQDGREDRRSHSFRLCDFFQPVFSCGHLCSWSQVNGERAGYGVSASLEGGPGSLRWIVPGVVALRSDLFDRHFFLPYQTKRALILSDPQGTSTTLPV